MPNIIESFQYELTTSYCQENISKNLPVHNLFREYWKLEALQIKLQNTQHSNYEDTAAE